MKSIRRRFTAEKGAAESTGLSHQLLHSFAIDAEARYKALYPKPRLSQPHLEHRVYPFLLRNVAIECINHVWSTDITYLPALKGHFYRVAILDWFSRKVLA